MRGQKNATYIACLVVFLLGSALLIGGIKQKRIEAGLASRGVRTYADVVESYRRYPDIDDSDRTIRYILVIAYNVNGRPYDEDFRVAEHAYNQYYRSGGQIPIIYDPQDPQEVRLAGVVRMSEEMDGTQLVGFGVTIMVGGIGMFICLRLYFRRQELDQVHSFDGHLDPPL